MIAPRAALAILGVILSGAILALVVGQSGALMASARAGHVVPSDEVPVLQAMGAIGLVGLAVSLAILVWSIVGDWSFDEPRQKARARQRIAWVVASLIAVVVLLPSANAALGGLPEARPITLTLVAPISPTCNDPWVFDVSWPTFSFPAGAVVQLHWSSVEGGTVMVWAQHVNGSNQLQLSTSFLTLTSSGKGQFVSDGQPYELVTCQSAYYSAPPPSAPAHVSISGTMYLNISQPL